MEQLYKATICKFKSIEKTDYSYRFIIDETSTKELIGTKDNNDFISLEDKKRYHILKRSGQFIEQAEQIEFDKYYVNQIQEYTKYVENKKNYLIELKKLLTKTKQKKKTL